MLYDSVFSTFSPSFSVHSAKYSFDFSNVFFQLPPSSILFSVLLFFAPSTKTNSQGKQKELPVITCGKDYLTD
ncbi:hypothetical protein GYMLUDRAFT_830330 [Collybiopsis luxurians FD-317 M1]|uniref:Uncharacterized protein n=1 Tax=Collybiopsis luxurians FD-317 M1 TaxID=944289 RepID=A0A0D0BM32_9AGAR|nr:hypothetical protein GYMLUDRAFT_830330 [Collybiopsis luxurians FD-317 M1]